MSDRGFDIHKQVCRHLTTYNRSLPVIEKAAAERYGYLPFGTDRGVSLLIFSITGAKTLDAAGEGLERLKEMLARIG